MVRTQLTHENVQKSMSTTLPRRSARVSGVVLSHPSMPVKSGAAVALADGQTWPPADAVAAGGGLLTTVKSTAAAIATAMVARASRYRFTWVHTALYGLCVEEPLRTRSRLLACDATFGRR